MKSNLLFQRAGGRDGMVKMKREGKLSDIFFSMEEANIREATNCNALPTVCWMGDYGTNLQDLSVYMHIQGLVSGVQFKKITKIKVSKSQLFFNH